MATLTDIPASELETRRGRLLEHARAQGLSGVVLFDEHYVRYFTALGFLATERPVAVALRGGGERIAFVPEFEVERGRPLREKRPFISPLESAA